MSEPATITLSVQTTSGGAQYTTHVRVDGTPVVTNRTLSPEDSQAVNTLATNYLSLFEGGLLPLVKQTALDDLGSALFDLWLGEDWEKVEEALPAAAPRHLVIASEVSAVLNLPWSLLRVPGDDEPIGLDPNASIRLHPSTGGLSKGDDDDRPGPLRVLYSACAPRDLGDLGYEKEEYQLIQTLSQRGDRVAHFGCDLGSFDEFQERLRKYRPHVVHLTGHGAVTDGEGQFAFEDERGEADLRRGSSIVKDALANRGVQCVFVSGCQTGQAPDVRAVNGICQGLVANHVPMAVGWAASILDDVATTFANTFYAEISAGETVDRAVVQARRASQKLCAGRVEDPGVVDASWTLPVLYTSTTQASLFDPAKAKKDPPKPTVEQRPLPGMTEGHADYFIGRRREQQRVLPDLKKGALNTVFLTGMGGVGKSTLATRLARILEKDEYTPIAVSSTEDKPLTVAGLLDRCCEVFLSKDLDDVYQRLRNDNIDLRDRLRQLVRALNQNRFVLVLDNLEVNLDRQSRKILNDDLAWFLPYLINNLTGSSRCLITTRYRPAELDGDLPKIATELSLSDFPESSFFKYLLDDETVEHRYLSGDLPRDLLSKVYTLLGGTPRFLEQVRESLAGMPTDKLRSSLDTVDLPDEGDDPSEDEQNELREIREQYIENLFIRDLYHAVEPEASRDALCRAAVYTIPMTIEGSAAAAGVEESDVQNWIQEWQRRTFVTPVETKDASPDWWTIPTLLRLWLLKQLPEEERTEAHRAAGEWLESKRAVSSIDEINEQIEVDEKFLENVLEERRQFIKGQAPNQSLEANHFASMILSGRGNHREVIKLNRELLELTIDPSLFNWCGRALAATGQLEEAQSYYRQALNTASGKDRSAESIALHGLATVRTTRGDFAEARKCVEEALKLRVEGEDVEMIISSLSRLGDILAEQGLYDDAESAFRDALKRSESHGTKYGKALALHGLGSVEIEKGNYDDARDYLREALDLKSELGSEESTGTTLHQLAQVELRANNHSGALKLYRRVIDIAEEQGDTVGFAQAVHQIGTILLREKEFEDAIEALEKARFIFQNLVISKNLGGVIHDLAFVHAKKGDKHKALSGLISAIKIRQRISDRSGEAATLAQLGHLAAEEGNREPALKLIVMSLLIFEKIDHNDKDRINEHISFLASRIGYSKRFVYGPMKKRVKSAYQEDRGWSLLREAFPDADFPDDVPPSGVEPGTSESEEA